MTRLALAAFLAVAGAGGDVPPPVLDPIAGGLATYYAPGVMERVLETRGLSCDDCLGFVALLTCERLGERVYLQRVGHEPEGAYMVADCSGHGKPFDRWLLDVDGETARRWGMTAPVFVSILEVRQ